MSCLVSSSVFSPMKNSQSFGRLWRTKDGNLVLNLMLPPVSIYGSRLLLLLNFTSSFMARCSAISQLSINLILLSNFLMSNYCSLHSAAVPEKSEGYVQVFLDGGLNQQRMGVCIAFPLLIVPLMIYSICYRI